MSANDERFAPLQDLGAYAVPSDYSPGRSRFIIALWILVDAVAVSSWVPGVWHRRLLLRAFGAKIGTGVVLKPRVRIKFPWKLSIGGHSWIGEAVWIDNIGDVSIGENVCISQGAYLCTGSHNWANATFDLVVQPIRIEDGAWIAAGAVVGPGLVIAPGAVLGLGSVATKNLEAGVIFMGNPAEQVSRRRR